MNETSCDYCVKIRGYNCNLDSKDIDNILNESDFITIHCSEFEPKLDKCVYYYEHCYYAMNPENSCRISCCANKSINKSDEYNRILCNKNKQEQYKCWRIKPLKFFERLLNYKE